MFTTYPDGVYTLFPADDKLDKAVDALDLRSITAGYLPNGEFLDTSDSPSRYSWLV